MKIKTKIAMPAPQAYSITEKYGIALNTAIMLLGKTQFTAVAGGVLAMPSKKPFAKLKSPVNGANKYPNKDPIFEIIYRATLKQSKAMWSMSSMLF
jgi:hypothetical protein